MARHDEYRESGVEWIDDVPVDWKTVRVRFLCKITTGDKDTVDRYDEGKYPFYVRSPIVEHINTFSFDGEAVLTAGDGVGAGRVFHYVNGKFDYHQRVYNLHSFKGIQGRYLYYFMQENFYKEIERGSAKSTVDSIRLNMLQDFVIAFPESKIEQCGVVDYLNLHTAQIDNLIADLKSQAEMLDRYKRELIVETVTKGLNKAAKMKDSGVDWIGDVPEHWDVTKIKWMFEIVKRIHGKEDRDVLSITQRGIKIKDIESNDGQLADSYANYQVVNVNDFAMNSMDLLTGWVDCSPFEGVTSPDYRVFRFSPDKVQSHNYFKYIFQMCYKNRVFYRLGQGVSNLGRWRLQADQFLNMYLPQPPVEEQEKIAAFLDEKTARIESLVADINSQIEKLKQYRQIVIHDAVTGKIKVPEVNRNGN